jgi:hypothetical protein
MEGRQGALASALCAILLLTACASAPPVETAIKPQNPQQARIYVMRDPDVHSEVVSPSIKVDNESVGDVAAARFLVVDRPPGQHLISVNFMQGYYPLTLTTRAGSVHYVQIALRPFAERFFLSGAVPRAIEQASTGHNGEFMLVAMSESEGRALLQTLMAGGVKSKAFSRD